MPNYGSVELDAGFLPDPHERAMRSGGRIDAVYLGQGCVGFVTSAPDYEVSYTSGLTQLLRFYWKSADDEGVDPTMIINDPQGAWHCSNDSFDTRDPTIDFVAPSSGTYDIWIGGIEPELFSDGALFVTEDDINSPTSD
jgi:hypothetical protein